MDDSSVKLLASPLPTLSETEGSLMTTTRYQVLQVIEHQCIIAHARIG